MADERIYVIPLRQKLKLRAKWKRANKAVTLVREFIKKHMKTEKVVLSKEINEELWSKGSKRPPGKVKVKAIKEEGKTTVQLVK